MAKNKKPTTDELEKSKEKLKTQWYKIVKEYEEIDEELSNRELKENYDRKYLAEIRKKYTGKIIRANTKYPYCVAYSLDFFVVKKIVPENNERFNIIGQYISVHRDGQLTNISVGTKNSDHPYLGIQTYKFEKETGFMVLTPEEMLGMIVDFKNAMEKQFSETVETLINEYTPNVKKKLPKKKLTNKK